MLIFRRNYQLGCSGCSNSNMNSYATSGESLPLRLRVDFAGVAFALLLIILFIGPWLRGLFFEPDLLPTLMVVALALLFLALDSFNRKTPWWSKISVADGAILVLTLLYFLSFFPAADRHTALVGGLKMAGYAGAYVLAARYVQRPHGLHRLAWTVFLSGSGVALLGWIVAAGWFEFPGAVSGGRLMSTFQYPNALAGALMVTLGTGAGLWMQATGLGRFLASAGTVLALVTLLATFSRAAWLIYVAVVALMILLSPHGRRWSLFLFHAAAGSVAAVVGSQLLPALRSGISNKHLLLLGAAVVAFAVLDLFSQQLSAWLDDRITNPLTYQILRGGLIAYVFIMATWAGVYLINAGPAAASVIVPTDISARFATITPVERSFLSRLEMSRDAWKLALDKPLLGSGAGGWNALYHQVQELPYWSTEVHNHYLQTAVEVGLTGFAAFIIAWIFIGFSGVNALTRLSDERGPILWGVTMGLLGLMVHAAADFDLSLPALSFWRGH